jgi:spore coat protein U-like protein
MPLMRAAPAIALGILLIVAVPSARAASTSCSASMSGLAFGAVDPFSGAVSTSATLNYSCTYSCSGLLDCLVGGLSGDFVSMCFNIESGAQGGGNCNPRRLLSGSNAMQFQIYKDAGYANSWGSDSGCGGTNVQVKLSFPLLGNNSSSSGSLPVYGRVPGSQTALVPGSYSNAFSGASTRLSYQSTIALLSLGTYPSCGTSNNGSFPFTASASVAKQCTVSATDIDFGARGPLTAAATASSTITAKCTNTTAYQLGLDDGSNASGTSRRMRRAGSGSYIGYELYSDTGHTQRWGNTLNVDRVGATGSAASQTFTVYGLVPAQTTPAAGTYTDTVKVTVTY